MAVEPSPPPGKLQLPAGEVNIIHGPGQREVALELQRYMARMQYAVRMLCSDAADKEEAARESICVFLLELDQPVWYDIAREAFVRLQKLLTTTSKAIWVQRGAELLPQFRLVDGVSRVLNSELDRAAPIHSFGVDSLVAVEIRNWMSNELRADVAIFNILEATPVADLGALVAGKGSYVA